MLAKRSLHGSIRPSDARQLGDPWRPGPADFISRDIEDYTDFDGSIVDFNFTNWTLCYNTPSNGITVGFQTDSTVYWRYIEPGYTSEETANAVNHFLQVNGISGERIPVPHTGTGDHSQLRFAMSNGFLFVHVVG